MLNIFQCANDFCRFFANLTQRLETRTAKWEAKSERAKNEGIEAMKSQTHTRNSHSLTHKEVWNVYVMLSVLCLGYFSVERAQIHTLSRYSQWNYTIILPFFFLINTSEAYERSELKFPFRRLQALHLSAKAREKDRKKSSQRHTHTQLLRLTTRKLAKVYLKCFNVIKMYFRNEKLVSNRE